jgi:DNA repair exonuclease SbcCD ATPase subunit
MITKLISENIKRVRAVTIKPDGSTVVIGGANGSGKSSTIDTIEMCLGGKKRIPKEPVRKGAKKARGVVETADLVVTRTWNAKGTQLEVRPKEKGAAALASPQKVLDKLVGTLSFDPLEFSRMDSKKQSETLRELVGLDFSLLDKKREQCYTERRDLGRDLKKAKGHLENLFYDESLGEIEQVPMPDLLKELERRRAHNTENDAKRTKLETLREKGRAGKAEVSRLVDALTAAKEALAEINTDGKALAAEVKQLEDEDCAEVQSRIANASKNNEQIHANAEYKRTEAEVDALQSSYDTLTEKITQVDDTKTDAIFRAVYPVDGLEALDDGVYIDGVPWGQASQAEQLKCSIAIGFALNPKLKILLIRDGSLLDSDSLAAVSKMAEEAGGQCWIETVTDGDDGGGRATVVIEDGAVK